MVIGKLVGVCAYVCDCVYVCVYEYHLSVISAVNPSILLAMPNFGVRIHAYAHADISETHARVTGRGTLINGLKDALHALLRPMLPRQSVSHSLTQRVRTVRPFGHTVISTLHT